VRSNEEKDAFHDKLFIVYYGCPKMDVTIIGYVTSNLGTENIYKPVSEKYGLRSECNYTGVRLINLASARNMATGRTIFNHKDTHKMTWK
jgi:hypothetical protein